MIVPYVGEGWYLDRIETGALDIAITKKGDQR